MMADFKVNKEQMLAAAGGGHSTATDIADWLVRVLNMPFRDAHHVTGSLVALADKKKTTLDKLTLQELQSIEAKITEDIFSVLSVEASVATRTSFGGTAPENVAHEAAKWIAQLEKE